MKSTIIYISLFLGLVLNLPFNLDAQDFQMYNMNQVVQRNKLNPAFSIDASVFAGFPLTSSTMVSYQNSGFTYSDLLKKDATDSLYLDIENAISKMDQQNNIHTEISNDIVWFGLNFGKNTITVNVTDKAVLDFSYTKSMMEFLYYGNGGFNGNTGNINPGIEGSHYREHGITWTRKLKKNISAGIRIKYLYGMEHIHSEGAGANLYTDPNDYTLYGYSDYALFTAGISENSFDDFSAGNYLIKKKNHGYGVDVGLNINATEKVELSVSMLDIGQISWKDEVVIYSTHTTDGPVVYQGIDLDEFINNGYSSEAYLENLGDSLYEAFDIQESTDTFKRAIPKQMYAGANYIIGEKSKTGIVLHLRETPSKTVLNYHVHYTSAIKDWLNFSLGYSSINNSQGNVGASLVFNFKGGQMYFTSDNILGMINYKNANVTGFRAGFNFIFKKKEESTPKELLPQTNDITVDHGNIPTPEVLEK